VIKVLLALGPRIAGRIMMGQETEVGVPNEPVLLPSVPRAGDYVSHDGIDFEVVRAHWGTDTDVVEVVVEA
jgi:hypothetical protein